MKIAKNLYTANETICPECGAKLTPIRFYQGKQVNHQTFNDDNLITGTKKITTVTTYVDVAPVRLYYCVECQMREEDELWEQNKPDQKTIDELNRKDKAKYTRKLVLSIARPIVLGVICFCLVQMKNDTAYTLAAFLAVATFWTVLFGIGSFRNALDFLRNPVDHGKKPFLYGWTDMTKYAIGVMTSSTEDPSIKYFTEEEYKKLVHK